MTATPDSRWQAAARHPDLETALAEDDAGTLLMGSPLRAISDDADVDEDVRYVSGLLATVAWFMPNGNDWTNPYGPFATFGDRRSPIPADFTDADIAVLADVAELVPNLILRSRILDVIAIAGEPARRATWHAAQLQALADHGVTSEAMTHSAEQWDRGLAVGVRFRGVASAQLQEIERQLVEAATTSSDGVLAVRAARMLGDHRLGRDHAGAIAAHLAAHAEGLQSIVAQDTLEVAAEWYRRAGNPEASEDATYAIVQRLGRVPQWSVTGSAHDDDMHDRHDLTDEQWDLLEPHLPRSAPGKAGRPWSDHRRVVNAVLWRTRAGAAWRDVPTGYGPWKTAYNRHRRWSGDGTWQRVLSELQRGSDTGAASWDVGIDSTVIRAHQHAAGAPHLPPSDVPAERLAVALEDFDSTRARPRSSYTGG